MAVEKFCVFCGMAPQSKNKEHILPQWLLRLTGDPKRRVDFGYDHVKGTTISFDWSSLTVPACEACNTEYSALEAEVSHIVRELVNYSALPVKSYLLLLDWLDKVRVGLWLNYYYILKNPVGISPSYHINSRVGKKDRFVAIYPVPKQADGLSLFGVDTPSFQVAPTAVGLRINNLMVISGSSDYIFSGRCGFPFPSSMKFHLDGQNSGMLELGDFKFHGKLKSPLLGHKLHKPSVFLFQPIMQTANESHECEIYLAENSISPGVGKIFRQFKDRVERLDEESGLVEFDSIKGGECKPASHLVAQVFELQNYFGKLYSPSTVSLEARRIWDKERKLFSNFNRKRVKYYIRSVT